MFGESTKNPSAELNLLEILVTVTGPLEDRLRPFNPLSNIIFFPWTLIPAVAPRILFVRLTPVDPLSLAVRLPVVIKFFEVINKPDDPLLLKMLTPFKVTGATVEAPELSIIAPTLPLFDAFNP